MHLPVISLTPALPLTTQKCWIVEGTVLARLHNVQFSHLHSVSGSCWLIGFIAWRDMGTLEILSPTLYTLLFMIAGLSFTIWLDAFTCLLALRSFISCRKMLFSTNLTTSLLDFSISSWLIRCVISHVFVSSFFFLEDLLRIGSEGSSKKLLG